MKCCFLIFLLFAFWQCDIFSFYGSVFKCQNNDHEIWFIADYHGSIYGDLTADAKHKNEREALFHSCDPGAWKMIVEDSAGYTGSHEGRTSFQKMYELGFSGSSLHGLCRLFEAKKIPVFNAEFRFLRDAGLSPILNPNNGISQLFFDYSHPITGEDMVNEFNEIIEVIKTYDDGAELKHYYNAQLEAVTLQHRYLNRKFVSKEPLELLAKKAVPKQKLYALIQALMSWDVRLFDARVIHEIVTTHTKKIGVFLGAAHIWNIVSVLENLLGYKKIFILGEERQFEYPVIDFEDLPDQKIMDALLQKKQKQKVKPLCLNELPIFNA